MTNPFGRKWKESFLRALKLAYERGHISRHDYYELKKEVKNE